VVEDKAYLIGGSNLGVDNEKDYIFDLKNLEWDYVGERSFAKKNAVVFKSIDEHTATAVGDQIYVFGGNIAGFKSNKILVFDTVSSKWTSLTHENAPCPRSCHSAALYNSKIYIFGGKDQDTNKLNDIWAYDIKTDIWNEVIVKTDSPLSRSGHSGSIFKNYMVVFGGIHELTQELNDIQAFDFNTSQWFSVVEEMFSPTHSGQHPIGFMSNKNAQTHNQSTNKNPQSTRNSPSRLGGKMDDFSLKVHKINKKSKRSRQHNLSAFNSHLTLSKIEKLVRK
jgi:N-acetylneuraminic acid mutarotase